MRHPDFLCSSIDQKLSNVICSKKELMFFNQSFHLECIIKFRNIPWVILKSWPHDIKIIFHLFLAINVILNASSTLSPQAQALMITYGCGCQCFHTTDRFNTIIHFGAVVPNILKDQTDMLKHSLCASH